MPNERQTETIVAFIHTLNNRLHAGKIGEDNRALLLSAILIALERPSFKKAYQSEPDPKRVAAMIIDAVGGQLEDADIPPDRLAILKQKFGFIAAETVITTKPNELVAIIRQIDDEVNTFVRNHEYHDVLGRLYVEFLRHANSDKGLGIVLTPPHITELFADLAQINEHSIVYDNCVGTGGFLISALARMIGGAKGDTSVEERIKQSQLYGVELQSDIYALAVSNMFIHQDGKSNIVLGDAFSPEIMREMREKGPTVGLLNPPYKADKARDREELIFVLNNLTCLQQGAVCVAILPMQSALATRGGTRQLKEEIMKRHTVECVLSMPDELFFNSKVGVVSCTMVFTAHRPHPKNKEIYFGYYKDDGFIKRKMHGRIDGLGKWAEIRVKWLKNYVYSTNMSFSELNRTDQVR